MPSLSLNDARTWSATPYLRAISNALAESAAAEAEHHLSRAEAEQTPTP